MSNSTPAVKPGTPTTADPLTQASDLLALCGLEADDHPAFGPQAVVADSSFSDRGFVSPVTELSLIRVSGQERLEFLQGQLTNDIDKLADNEAQFTGLCSPKGRLMASFIAIKTPDAIDLIVTRSIASAIARRLAMYVLRAKVKVTDISADALILALVGPDAVGVLTDNGLDPVDPMQVSANEDAALVSLSPVTVNDQPWPRFLLVVPKNALADRWAKLSAALPVRGGDAWRAMEIATGTARISAPIQESFVPQMINFELIGGVDFDKGCFTGQEVIARSQHLGKMKRRMFVGALGQSQHAPLPGDEVKADDRTIGVVVSSASGQLAGRADQTLVLFEASVDDAKNVLIDGQPVEPMDLPYAIPEPTPFVRPRL